LHKAGQVLCLDAMTKPTTPANLNQRKDSWKGELQIRPESSQLTDQELAFVQAYVGNGGDAKLAGQATGLADPGASLAKPAIREAIELKRDTEIKTTGATRAWSVIEQLMTDPSAPAQVRLQAAKWTLEASGHGLSAVAASLQLGLKRSGKPLAEMSVTELEDFITRGRATFDSMRQTVKTVAQAYDLDTPGKPQD
jgi:hypothetical protein